MKKVLFISTFNSQEIECDGVFKKIWLQINTFKDFGFDVDYIEIRSDKVLLVSEDEAKVICERKKTYHNTYVSLFRALKNQKTINYDLIYYRYEHISFSMISYFKFFQLMKKESIVVGELPTYMKSFYKNSTLKNKISFLIKRFLDNYLPKYIDYLVTFSEHTKLFRVPTIQIENFVDVDSLKVKKCGVDRIYELHLLALANITPAHGFDRVIEGLRLYYKEGKDSKIKVFLHIVGDGGKVKNDLEELVSEYHLKEFVIFHGKLGGSKLDNIFDLCNIGISSLAIFRKGSKKLSELKIREYTARCLPFIYNAEEPILKEQDFCLRVPFDESPISISSIIEFNEKIKKDANLSQVMRDFAEEHFTSKSQLQKVLDVCLKSK
ncbi:glycosyltransferase [Myroides odoratimimus]|uniref:glycosyltransferase n=1 Tax=Myroides odoratimimus TaxID=76832 RepID=UPI0025772699|nr:glycosyltransferase [Myroides odoratimimus]MDM1447996.1 glycosyltransferase [Myroides odoratimimus]